jgi:Ricin-type beta-trefoil lectin domain-like
MGAFSFPQKTTGTDNQLWEFVADPAGSGYYYIKSKLDGNVIDIQRASTSVGAGLDAFPQNSTGTDNQLWQFLEDPAGSGYCFIKSKLDGNVIDIQQASTSAGAGLDTFLQKISGTDNQLWAVVGGSFPSTVRRCRRRLLDCSVIPTTTSTAA